LAQIADKEITIGDFLEYYLIRLENSTPQNRPSTKTTEQTRQLLDELLTSKALLISAEREGYLDKPEFKNKFGEFLDKTLEDYLVNDRCKDYFVSDEAVQDY
jgi:hypothetical protein